MFGALNPAIARVLRRQKLKRGVNPDERRKDNRMQRHRIRLQGVVVKTRLGSSCSSHGRQASPSVRIDSSSCGSRRVLRSSSVRQEPYTPSPEPHRPPATAESLRIGAEASLYRGEYPEFRIATTGSRARPRAHLQAEPTDDRQFGSRTDGNNATTAGLEFVRMSMNAK